MPRWFRTLLALLLVVVPARAQRLTEADVPPELRPWIPWVQDRPHDEGCRLIDEQAVCVWPGVLALELGARGGTFSQRAVASVEAPIVLPGDAEHWPQEVRIDKKEAVVLDQDGTPAVLLPAGTHTVTGRFSWRAVPDHLAIPPTVGLLTLRVGDRDVAFPERTAGSVRIDADLAEPEPAPTPEGASDEPEPDRVSLQVFRRIEDGVPLRVVTHLRLRVSGAAREENLGDVLLKGSEALRLDGPLPLQLRDSRELLAQVRPGTYDIEIVARIATPPAALSASKRPDPWPDHEIWVWSPNAELRQVELGGAPPTDPTTTDLPDDWKSLTAFRLAPGTALTFKTVRRGVPDPPPNDLRLERALWLDLDGSGWSVRDRITGSMHQGWRLDLLAGKLGHAVVHGEPRLITKSPKGAGVELRGRTVDLQAEWHTDAGSQLPAAGWSEDFEGASAVVNLPEGWELFHVSGVDDHSGTWVDSWSLVDVLWILLIVVIAAKVAHPLWGAVAAVALVLGHGAGDAPLASWLVLLVVAALTRVAAPGLARRGLVLAWWGAALALVAELATFAVEDLGRAFYPTVEHETGSYRRSRMAAPAEEEAAAPAAAYDAAREGGTGTRAKGEMGSLKLRAGGGSNKRYAVRGPKDDAELSLSSTKLDDTVVAQKAQLLQAAAQAQTEASVVQTGPGMPEWTFQSWRLSWSGAVTGDQSVRLWLVSPTASRARSIVRVALLGLLGLGLLRRTRRDVSGTPPSGAAAAAAALTLALGLLAPARASAETPSPEILEELGRRLEREPVLAPQPDCAPRCVSVSRIDGTLEKHHLEIVADVHAAGPGTYPLPGPANLWVPSEVRVDGKVTEAIALAGDGFLHVRLDPGHHEIRFGGPLGASSLSLDLASKPKLVRFRAEGWSVDGIDDNEQAESVQLTYTGQTAPGAEDGASESGTARGPSTLQALPTWLSVERELTLGATWLVTTTVRRVSPGPAPIVVKIPLLATERVTTSGVQVEKGQAVVTLASPTDTAPVARTGASSVSWVSVLQSGASLVLTAPPDLPWTESWSLTCDPTWHCSTDGVPPTRHARPDAWSPVFNPWPGEHLTVGTVRPEPAGGASVTVDHADMTLTPGPRQTDGRLTLRVRSSSIGRQTVELAKGTTIQSAQMDGTAVPIAKGQTRVDFALQPGSHGLFLTFRTPETERLVTRAPAVTVNGGAANAVVTIEVPHGRFAAVVGGPGSGPALRIWGWLTVLLLAGFALGRVPGAPLSSARWMVLFAGLTRADAGLLVALAAWFFAVGWRQRKDRLSPWQHDTLQVLLAVMTGMLALGLVEVVLRSLTGAPHLMIQPSALATSASSGGGMSWYVDRIQSELPRPWVVTAPTWVWQGLHLVWVLWLGLNLTGWAKWAWGSFGTGGLWKPLRKPTLARAADKPVAVNRGAAPAESPADATPGAPQTEPVPAGATDPPPSDASEPPPSDASEPPPSDASESPPSGASESPPPSASDAPPPSASDAPPPPSSRPDRDDER